MLSLSRILLISCIGLAWRTSTEAAPPNLVLILADDLGWSDLGCYGNTFNETPSLDRLAREGMRFTQFYAGPVCSPTRANLQSGQDQARFGITQHIPGHRRPYAKLADPQVPPNLPLEVETFAERLAASGYRTGYLGKWHLGKQGFGPGDQGWQEAFECGGNVQRRGDKAERTASLLTDKAIAFIESTSRAQPFLLQVSHCAVHITLSTTPELLAKYQGKKPMPNYPSNPLYAGLLEELDQSVGRITDCIDRLGLAENTVILFLSDNGGLEHEQDGDVVTSNRPLRGEKGSLYEGGIRIPAIARWRGQISEGAVSTTIARTHDVYPTFLELAGVSPPRQPVDGVSLVKLLRDPDFLMPRDVFWHLPHYHHSTPAGALRRGDWKLLEFFEDGRLELFNLAADPAEQNNLASAEPVRAKELQSALAHWRKEIGARMPTANPNHDPARASHLAKGKGKSE